MTDMIIALILLSILYPLSCWAFWREGRKYEKKLQNKKALEMWSEIERRFPS